MDSVQYYKTMHVVRVDYPTDDGIADFLTVDQNVLDYLPNKIYVSDNGTYPLDVKFGVTVNLTQTTSSKLKVSLFHCFVVLLFVSPSFDVCF